MLYAIFPPEELVEDAAVALPLSKSISTRCMVLDALTESAPDNSASIAVCDDTAVIADALAAWRGAPAGAALTLDMKASGAALRFLTAFFAATPGADVTLTGIPRLLERPMGILVDALRACGAEIDYTGREQSDYSDAEIEEFRDVLLTLQPDDIAPWARSIQLRGIRLPDSVREELLLIVAEARASRSH